MKILPGLILASLFALPAWYFGGLIPLAGGPILALFGGMVLSFFFPALVQGERAAVFGPGLRTCSKKVLQIAIVLIGFGMNLSYINALGAPVLLVLGLNALAVFLCARAAGAKLKPQKRTLIAVGTAICGGSAIAAAAPVIRASDEDVAQALSTVFLFNLAAVFVFPLLGRLLSLGDLAFGVWAGLGINDTSSVVAAASAWSNAAGNDSALSMAILVKLIRTLMILPVTAALALYHSRGRKGEGGSFRFTAVFPWFILFFGATVTINTLEWVGEPYRTVLVQGGRFFICMAMAAIGLNSRVKELLKSGLGPLALGGLLWFLIAGLSLAALRYITL
ncbi:MAG: putative sulfate exporter family transporter [Treponema sp.]|nr:putative sulfate exporter family transporter [Treponema sp.]